MVTFLDKVNCRANTHCPVSQRMVYLEQDNEALEYHIQYLKGDNIPIIDGLTRVQTKIVSILFARMNIVSRLAILEQLQESGLSDSHEEKTIDVVISHIRKALAPDNVIESIHGEGYRMTDFGREWYRHVVKFNTINPNEEDFENFKKRRNLMLREPRCDDKFTADENAYIRHFSTRTTAEGASRIWQRIFGRKRTVVSLLDQAARLGVLFKPAKRSSGKVYNADQEAFLRTLRSKRLSMKEMAIEYNKHYGTDHDYVSLRNHLKAMGLGSKKLFVMKPEYLLEAHRQKDNMTATEFRKWLEEESGYIVSSATVAHIAKRENIQFVRKDGRGKRWSKKTSESELHLDDDQD